MSGGRHGKGRLTLTRLSLVVIAAGIIGCVLAFTTGWASDQPDATTPTSASTTAVARTTSGARTINSRTISSRALASSTPHPEPAKHASPLPPAAAYLAGRLGTVSIGVYDLATHQTWTAGGTGQPQDEASIVKVNILEALLAQRPAGLTAADKALAQQMIEDSDNDAATALWDAADGAVGIRAFNDRAGLTRTTPSACVQCPGFPWPGWGLTTTTPRDQLTLLRELVSPGSVLNAAARKYALHLMEDVTPDQRWGVSAGVPSRATVALKDGWLPLNAADTDWQINSLGWVSGLGRNYLIAVLSTGNPSEAYGIDTIDELSAIVWRQLAGPRQS
jgi:beta-lactamase family protein